MPKKLNLAVQALLIFLISLSFSVLITSYLYFDAKDSWKNKAVIQVEEVSRVFSYWLDLEVKTLNSIGGMYYSFPKVKEEELKSITRYFQQASSLDTTINVGLINEDHTGKLFIEYSTSDVSLLNSSMDLSANLIVNDMVNRLLVGNEEIVVSNIFTENKQAFCYIATLAPSDNFGGILVSLLPLQDILESLSSLYFEKGLSLDVSNGHLTVPINVTKEIQGKRSFHYQQRMYHSGIDWQLDWSVYENYQAGMDNGFVLTSFISGAVISLLISILFWELMRRNEQVINLVARRTHELENANQQLERAKNELVNADKMASLGRLVAGMSHELNTPIGISLTGASAIHDKTMTFKEKASSSGISKKTFEQYISLVEESSNLVTLNLQRASRLIGNLKHVSVDQQSDRFRDFDLHSTITDIVNTLHHLVKQNNITLEVAIPEGITMKSYPGAIAQVFTNLITNSITHGFQDKASGVISIELTSKSEKELSLVYQDDGCGIAQEYIDKVFEPFFTTKLSQGGSGIGLNIVYTKITQHLQGAVELTSEVGQGVSFVITLPLSIAQKNSVKDVHVL